MRTTLAILLAVGLAGCATTEPEYQSPFAGAMEVNNPAWKSRQQHEEQQAERARSERAPSRRELRR